MSDFEGATEAFKRALAMNVTPESAAMLHSNLAAAEIELALIPAALANLDAAVEIATRIGKVLVVVEANIRRGSALVRAGDVDSGIGHLESGIHLARERHFVEPLLEGLLSLGRAQTGRDTRAALAALREAKELAQTRGDVNSLRRIDAALAGLV